MKQSPRKEPDHLPLPSRPYERGKAKPLVLCADCKCYMPVQHRCLPERPD